MSSLSEEQRVAPFLSVQSVITKPISTLSLLFFIYGIYVMTFGSYLHALSLDNNRPKSKFYLAGTVSLFILATTTNVFEAWLLIRQSVLLHSAALTRNYDGIDHYLSTIDGATASQLVITDIAPVVMNIIADAMLIHRCYVIWGSRKQIGYPLILLSSLINGIGLAGGIALLVGNFSEDLSAETTGDTMTNAFSIANAGFNLLLTLLTAGRIWRITREARALMGNVTAQRYKTIVAIILESGSMYPLVLIVTAVFQLVADREVHGLGSIDLNPLVWQVSGLAPTLIISRAYGGKTVESVGQVMSSTLHFAMPSSGGEVVESDRPTNSRVLGGMAVDLQESRVFNGGNGDSIETQHHQQEKV